LGFLAEALPGQVPDLADGARVGGVDPGATNRFTFGVLQGLQDDDEKYLWMWRFKHCP